ncbi:hypothetical protein F183_A11330 [Bryobacterales bacterium F-183]|nr:hypothetical protein F183_A11330 [Bryobacterales bacterium F-183]
MIQAPVVLASPELYIAGLRERVDVRTAGPRIGSLWRKLTMAGEIEGQVPNGLSYGASIYASQTEFDYLAGVPLKNGFTALPEGYTLLEVPAQTWLVFEHRGHMGSMPGTIHNIWAEWFPSQTEWRPAPQSTVSPMLLEVYDEERFDPKQGSGIVELWVAADKAATAAP